MGNAQALPVVGETVTAIESGYKITFAGACKLLGDDEAAESLAKGAGQAWVNYSERNLIAATTNVVVKLVKKDKEGADRIAKKALDALEGLADSTPVIGHAKAIYHVIRDDDEHAKGCFIGATRSSAVLIAGALTGCAAYAASAGAGVGFTLGGAAGVSTGVGFDKAISHAKDKPDGTIATFDEFRKTENPNILADGILSLGGDFVAGGSTALATMNVLKANRAIKQRKPLTKAYTEVQNRKEVQFNVPQAVDDTISAAEGLHRLKRKGILTGDRHTACVLRDTSTNEKLIGYSSRARQNINVNRFKNLGPERSGFPSKRQAIKAGKKIPGKLIKENPSVKQVSERPQSSCAEIDAHDYFSGMASNAQLVSVQFANGIYSAVVRCPNCAEFANLMGSVLTDYIAGKKIPVNVANIGACVTKACACGCIGVATAQRK